MACDEHVRRTHSYLPALSEYHRRPRAAITHEYIANKYTNRNRAADAARRAGIYVRWMLNVHKFLCLLVLRK